LLFQVVPLRFSFVAKEAIHFPAGQSSNLLRGAFGMIFRQLACMPQCHGAEQCEHRHECPYARIFEPRRTAKNGPSGFADQPRPFVFRAMHLDGQSFAAGESFHFGLNLFDRDPRTILYFVRAFAQLGKEGLGAGRRKAELVEVSGLNEFGRINAVIYRDGLLHNGPKSTSGKDVIAPVSIELASPTMCTEPAAVISRLRIQFVTPTELKGAAVTPGHAPPFGVLAARARDRVSLLRELYGEGALELDFRGFGDRAALVKIKEAEVRQVSAERRSSRTNQVHSIGGLVGEVEYEGRYLEEFLPFIKAAKWTGVGRQTVWGKGEIAVVHSATLED
jgi:hypothetical protein